MSPSRAPKSRATKSNRCSRKQSPKKPSRRDSSSDEHYSDSIANVSGEDTTSSHDTKSMDIKAKNAHDDILEKRKKGNRIEPLQNIKSKNALTNLEVSLDEYAAEESHEDDDEEEIQQTQIQKKPSSSRIIKKDSRLESPKKAEKEELEVALDEFMEDDSEEDEDEIQPTKGKIKHSSPKAEDSTVRNKDRANCLEEFMEEESDSDEREEIHPVSAENKNSTRSKDSKSRLQQIQDDFATKDEYSDEDDRETEAIPRAHKACSKSTKETKDLANKRKRKRESQEQKRKLLRIEDDEEIVNLKRKLRGEDHADEYVQIKPRVPREEAYISDDEVAAVISRRKRSTAQSTVSTGHQWVSAQQARKRKQTRGPHSDLVEREVLQLLEEMLSAAEEDAEAVTEGRPALEKVRILPYFESMVAKYYHRPVMIDSGLLPVLSAWLRPVGNGELPNVQVRRFCLEVLTEIGTDADWVGRLAESQGLGKAVHYLKLWDPDTTNQRLAEKLVEKWARKVFKREDDMDDLAEDEVREIEEKEQKDRRAVRKHKTYSERLDSFNTWVPRRRYARRRIEYGEREVDEDGNEIPKVNVDRKDWTAAQANKEKREKAGQSRLKKFTRRLSQGNKVALGGTRTKPYVNGRSKR